MNYDNIETLEKKSNFWQVNSMFNRDEFITEKEWKRFREFSKDFATPNIVVDLRRIKKSYVQLKDSFPYANIYYAVKANPGVPVLKLLE